jgi:hypothetical protein
MGVEGRRFVVAHCDLGRMCEGYRAVYQSASKAS